jgi:hypothetical protein
MDTHIARGDILALPPKPQEKEPKKSIKKEPKQDKEEAKATTQKRKSSKSGYQLYSEHLMKEIKKQPEFASKP